MTPASFSFDALRRHPDVEAPNLFAADAADRLILEVAAEALAASAPGDVAVIGDNYGALTLGAAAIHAVTGIRVHQDALTGELALNENARRLGLLSAFTGHELDAALLTGARIVLLRLPKSLSALDEIADTIARFAAADVTIYAGAMLKHMTRSMNDVLGTHFASVQAGLARQKARVLTIFSGHRSAAGEWPHREYHADLGIWVCAHGGAFAGTSIDIGTRFLLGFLDQAKADATAAIDLGCGTGVLATVLAHARSGIQVVATDQSTAAVASARETAAVNGVADRVTVLRDDALSAQPAASADLILLNPPFHLGTSVHAGAGLRLIEDAGRVLRQGGELWTVFNSHLAYQSTLRRIVGRTRQVGRNAKFTVMVSTKD